MDLTDVWKFWVNWNCFKGLLAPLRHYQGGLIPVAALYSYLAYFRSENTGNEWVLVTKSRLVPRARMSQETRCWDKEKWLYTEDQQTEKMAD